MPFLALPEAIRDELRAANARLVSEFDGPEGRHVQIWVGGRGALVLAEVYPDGKVFLWQPLAHEAVYQQAAVTLRTYLTGDGSS